MTYSHMTLCRHCGRGKINRPRGLCWNCYYKPGVKELYPAKFFPQLGLGVGESISPLPIPTRALPGTAAKLAVLLERVKNRQALFHPLDAQYDDGDDRINRASARARMADPNSRLESA